eukprot:621264_1
MDRSQLQLQYLNTLESIGFIVCFVIFVITLYHIYFRVISASSTSTQSLSSASSISSTHSKTIDRKIKWLALPAILLYSISCLTNIFSIRNLTSTYFTHLWFVVTQCTWTIATDLSHLLFICQLYIVYNQNNTIYSVSKTVYTLLFILVGLFTVAMVTKSVLIIILDDGHITPVQYGYIGAIAVCVSVVTNLLITISVLYLFHSRLSFTIKQLQSQSHAFGERLKRKLTNVRVKQTILMTFAVVTSQLYLMVWTVTVLIWYTYEGRHKDEYVYHSTILTLTLRTTACITNSLAIWLNFKFSTRYYQKCCRWCIICYDKGTKTAVQNEYYPIHDQI